MFDKYIICEDGFKNVKKGEAVTGFQFQCRLPYYRGLGISMVEELNITVDGQEIPREAVQVELHGNVYTLDEMEINYEDRWEFGEKGIVTIQKAGGLQEGDHTIFVSPHLRISYLPFTLVGKDEKTLKI